MANAFIEFKVISTEQIPALERFVKRLSLAKQSGEFPIDSEWETYFAGQPLLYFEDLSPEEMQEWQAEWTSAPVDKRHRDLSLWPHWDFGSFLDALKNGEFLVSGVKGDTATFRLWFEPMAFPFGGSECLVAVVEAFGQQVVGVHDGAEYRQYFKQKRWQPKSRRKASDAPAL